MRPNSKTDRDKIYILHGWTSNPKVNLKWQPLIEKLELSGFETEFLAIPGLDVGRAESWQLSDYINWLKEEVAGESSLILLGHSFGGQIISKFASIYPDLVRALILIDAAGVRQKSILEKVKIWVLVQSAKAGKGILKIVDQSLVDKIRPYFCRLADAHDYLAAPNNLRQTLANILKADVTPDLKKIEAPSLIIWGRHDKMTPLHHAKIYQREIANSQLEVIIDARHSPQYTHQDKVVELIRDFLQDNSHRSEE